MVRVPRDPELALSAAARALLGLAADVVELSADALPSEQLLDASLETATAIHALKGHPPLPEGDAERLDALVRRTFEGRTWTADELAGELRALADLDGITRVSISAPAE
jgi:hypothetical protein